MPLSQLFDAVPIAAFRSFVAVVEAGGFSAAARHRGVAVSTISKHVGMLEACLRTDLTLRTTRRVSVTEAGSDFYEQCRQMLDRLDETVEASLPSSELRGRLSLIAPPSFTRCILAPALPRFLASHPDLHVEVRVTPAPPDFLRDGVDLAVRMTDTHAGGDRVERIGPAPSVLCASPGYLARHGVPERPEDLSAHRCLGGLSSPYGERWLFKVERDLVAVPIRSVFSTDMGDLLREACLSDLGIGGFYDFHVKDDVAAGRLVPVLGTFQADVSALYVVVPGTRYASSKTTAFVSFLRETWRQQAA
ncbi:LysR family transcriptional regulator [Enterovirga rhinocerotis]|uniref:LysR family transcriptional regulator n=1 Tax=Enterovirga rhinocerotis TaxID=1339210 RepID=UPI0014152DDF|nr:LysR family transcriptional regulator [Enterovirga rhinocerotis]